MLPYDLWPLHFSSLCGLFTKCPNNGQYVYNIYRHMNIGRFTCIEADKKRPKKRIEMISVVYYDLARNPFHWNRKETKSMKKKSRTKLQSTHNHWKTNLEYIMSYKAIHNAQHSVSSFAHTYSFHRSHSKSFCLA